MCVVLTCVVHHVECAKHLVMVFSRMLFAS